MTQFPESEDVNHSGNGLLCSKGKRGTASEGVDRHFNYYKDGDTAEPAAALESAQNCNSGDRLKDSHSYSLVDGRDNMIANCSNSGEIPCCLVVKNSKKRLHSIADEGASRFLEYWLPVQISFHQLEQYCDTLLSNSIHLCSSQKKVTDEAIRETLLCVRKCCDHPYSLDASFQDRLVTEEKRQAPEVLDVAIRVSGKLEVLDMMLTEIRARGSQVLILFQLHATSGNVMPPFKDLFDEFLLKKFGRDSYEWIDSNSSKKQAAVDRFNKKENGAFILVMEKVACSSTIKLLSVDNIIIYGSHGNPSNDLKALQKLSFDAKLAQVKVFRLYSSYTIEEGALILAKKNVDVASSFQTISRAIVDNMLMWGASHLFSKLNDFHAENSSSLNVSSQQSFLNELMEEFRSILGGSYDNGHGTSIISRANKLDAGGYRTNVPLLGETKITMREGEEPHLFWKKVLELKSPPRWKFFGEQCPRNRKRVQFSDVSPSEPDMNNVNVGNKRRKAGIDYRDTGPVQVELNGHQETQIADAERARNSKINQTSSVSEGKTLESADRTVFANDHNSLHNSLLAELKKLSDILNYTENVTGTAIKFLEYITKNNRVNSDSPAIVQAFQISLCWSAASISKMKVDKKESLRMAKHHLNYQCSEEDVHKIYQIMRNLKNKYLTEEANRDSSGGDEGVVQPMLSSARQNMNKEIGEKSDGEHFEIRGGGNEVDGDIVKIQKKCLKRQRKLERKQLTRMQQFHREWEGKMSELEKDHEVQVAFVRSIYVDPVRKEKFRDLEDVFSKKMKEHNLLRDEELRNLEAEHLAAMNAEKQKADMWLTEAKACSSGPTTSGPPTPEKKLVTSDSKNEVDLTGIDRSSMDVVEQPTLSKYSCDTGEPACMEPPALDNHSVDLTKESPVEVPETSSPATDPEENVLQNKMEALDLGNMAAAQRNQNELVGKNQHSSHLEVPELLEPVIAVTDVQANSGLQEDTPEGGNEGEPEEGEILESESPTMENQEDEPEEGRLHEGEPEEGEIQGNESPAMEKQSTIQATNSVSVATIVPVQPIVENPEGSVRFIENQHTLETQVGMLEPVDSPSNPAASKPVDHLTNAPTSTPDNFPIDAPSDVELQERVAPVVENESTSKVANSDVLDTVDPVQPIVEQAHTDAPIVATQSTNHDEVPITKTANAAIPLQLSIEVPVIMNSERMERASPSCNQHEADHVRSEQRINISQAAEVAETDILLQESISQTEENLDVETSIHGQSVELPTSERNAGVSQAVIGALELSGEAVLQHGTNAGHYSRTGYPVLPTAHQLHSWTPQSLLGNPLRNEVERMNKEKYNLEKSHADLVARLKCDCEREIEEVTNQIRQKYAVKLQEGEAEFMLRKIGLVKNLEQACMNLKLAETFSEKCLDRPPGNTGNQQGTSGVHMQQMPRLLVQPRVPASASSFPTSPSHSIANPTQLSPNHLNANPVQPFPRHLNASHVEQRAMVRVPLPHPVRSSPANSHSVMVPPIQAIQRPAAPVTAPPSRPPVISSITPRNPRISGEIRCQAPHLQSSRSAHGPTVPPTSLPSISQYQSVLPPSQPSVPNLSQNGSGHQPQGGVLVQPSASASALLHLHRHHPASLPEQSQLGAQGNVQVNHASSTVAEDLVCLSDDD